MGLSLRNIEKHVDGEIHLTGVNLNLEPGSRNVVLGRTLAGKTSLLRIMAGLDRPSSGKLFLNGNDITGLSVRKRSVAMVYQQFINYPNFTVYDNIASPLRESKTDRAEIENRVMEVARVLHLESMLERLPTELSGGQQQRCAIARALAKDAHLLLLDEPLVNLDYKLREELQEELQEIFKERESIVVYTTTESAEALKLGGNIVVMDEGRVVQSGITSDVYRNPGNLKVAEIFSDPPINYFPGKIINKKMVMGRDLEIRSSCFESLTKGSYTCGIRANHLSLERKSPSDIELKVIIDLSEINGSETFIHGHYSSYKIVIQEVGIHSKKIGSTVSAFISPSRFFVFSHDGNLVISPESRL